MDIVSVTSAITQAYEIIKTLLKLKVDSEVLAKVSELQCVLAEVQTSQLSLLEQNSSLVRGRDSLENEIAALKNWEKEARRYRLYDIERGIVVYVLKKKEAQDDPPHWLCPDCFSKGKKGILNRIGKTNDMDYHYRCPCGYELIIRNTNKPEFLS